MDEIVTIADSQKQPILPRSDNCQKTFAAICCFGLTLTMTIGIIIYLTVFK